MNTSSTKVHITENVENPLSMFSLHSSKVLVTGASGAIGRGIAMAFAQQGATVIVHGTNPKTLQETADQLETISSQKPLIITSDLSCFTESGSLFERVEERVGPVDILINNAGLNRDNLAIRMKEEEWSAVIQVNLTAPFLLCRAAIKSMIKRRYGRIINISSVVATMGNPGQSNYCAAKSGLIGMSKALAREVAARQITVNCVAPGFVDSPMTQNLSTAQREVIINGIPSRNIGTPQDVAAVCVFLASKEARYITGQTIHVNGGLEMI
jgi:3-oxoacyl-[acyl-carrier protein] reductase